MGVELSAAIAEPGQEEPRFQSAEAAIRFAMATTGAPGRPLMNRMVDTRTGDRELAGADRAGEAGMILGHLKFGADPLDDLELAVITARCAPMAFPCHCRRACCSGRAQNREWRQAIDLLAARSASRVPRCSNNFALRSLIVLKIVTGKSSFRRIAGSLGLDEETVSRQHRSILHWLAGERAKGAERAGGIEGSAWQKAESTLRRVGIVG